MLYGLAIDVEVRPPGPGYNVDLDALYEWCLGITEGIVHKQFVHNDLLYDSVHIRVTSKSGSVIMDTISERAIRVL